MKSNSSASEYASFSKYPVINEADLHWGLAVAAVGRRRTVHVDIYPPRDQPTEYFFESHKGRVLGEYQLMYITRGSGTFQSQHVPQTTVSEGDIILLHPGEWHTYRPDDPAGWDEYWVGFKGQIVDDLVRRGYFKVATPIYHIGIDGEIVALYNQIIEIATEEKAGFQQMLGGLVYHLLSAVQYTLRDQQFSDREIIKRIERAKIIMQENVFSTITPEEIAAELNLSYSWFRRAFKEYTGFSPASYISALKLKKAKTMLVSTQKSVKEISLSLHFENSEYFSTFFKKMTGKSPVAYRKHKQV